MADFRYDANGNQTVGDGRTLAYDAFDNPLAITEGANQVQLAYAPSLGRYKRQAGHRPNPSAVIVVSDAAKTRTPPSSWSVPHPNTAP